MKNLRSRKIIYLLVIIFFYLWGVFTVKEKIFPYYLIKVINQNLFETFLEKKQSTSKKMGNSPKRIALVEKYSLNQDIWRDRTYFNKKNDHRLKEFFIIEIIRHLEDKVYLEFLEDVVVYRPLCKKNDNVEYSIFNGWNKASFEMLIEGNSCIHKEVYKKKFKKGTYSFSPGGPISSDPIFIEGLKNIKSIKVK